MIRQSWFLLLPFTVVPGFSTVTPTVFTSPPHRQHQAQSLSQDCNPGIIGCPPRNIECHPDVIECPDRGFRFDWLDQAIPYAISPRRSKVFNPRPLLQWSAVPNATAYTVTLQGKDLRWQTQTTDTQIRYTGDTALEPGAEYEFSVETDTGESSWDEPSHLGGVAFQMFTDAEHQAFVAAVQTQQADPATQPLDMANLYLNHGLISEGIAQLEALHHDQPTTAIAIQLGNLYFEWLLLPTVAEDYYQQAIANPEPTLEQAVALVQLGHVQAVMHDPEAAILYWQDAQAVYRVLGDLEQVDALEKMIAAEQN